MTPNPSPAPSLHQPRRPAPPPRPLAALLALTLGTLTSPAAELTLPLNAWVKLSPLTNTPPSPRLGYEGACAWDSTRQVLLRYGGHNQGGGGEQHSETWTFDPRIARWNLKEPNTLPPGICCGQQNVFDPGQSRYLRFPSFSGSHGWQWWREIYLNDSSVWSYDLAENKWRNLRPVPTAQPKPLRCAAWDSEHGVVVLFGGETSSEGTLVYDPWDNSWTRKKPARQPEFRSGGNLAYDSLHRLHILFGAQFINDPHTWAYSLRSNAWFDLQPPTLPPTDKNDAVLAFDPFSGQTLAVVRVSDGKEENAKSHLETWALDTAKNAWTKMNPTPEPPPSGSRARNLVFAPELNAFLLENRTHPPSGPAEQQVWAYRLTERKPTPAAPPPLPLARAQPRLIEDIVVSVLTPKQIELTWKKSPAPDLAGYHVERARVEVATEDQLKRLKKQTPPLAEPSVGAVTRIGPFTRLTTTPLPRFHPHSSRSCYLLTRLHHHLSRFCALPTRFSPHNSRFYCLLARLPHHPSRFCHRLTRSNQHFARVCHPHSRINPHLSRFNPHLRR